MPNDPVDIVHDGTAGRATVQRSALPVHAKAGWRPADPTEVIDTDANIVDVLAEVGDDAVKARAAIEVETANRGRKTLLTQLQTIADRSDQTGAAGDPEEQ